VEGSFQKGRRGDWEQKVKVAAGVTGGEDQDGESTAACNGQVSLTGTGENERKYGAKVKEKMGNFGARVR